MTVHTTAAAALLLLLRGGVAEGLSNHRVQQINDSVNRRTALAKVLAAPATATLANPFAIAPKASAAVPPTADSTERSALLAAIATGSPDGTVLSALEDLVKLDPSGGRGAAEADDLGGEWKLLWSIGADAFSPLLTLPPPFRPESYQYLGPVAAEEVGEGRVAQGLVGGVLGPTGLQLWLSSGAVVDESDPSVLNIKPPFRFQLGGRVDTGKKKMTIVEAGSDADFRAANARTAEAQAAPPNKYKQLYLEGGGAGALRISTITEGDPVIVGAVFVHQKTR